MRCSWLSQLTRCSCRAQRVQINYTTLSVKRATSSIKNAAAATAAAVTVAAAVTAAEIVARAAQSEGESSAHHPPLENSMGEGGDLSPVSFELCCWFGFIAVRTTNMKSDLKTKFTK